MLCPTHARPQSVARARVAARKAHDASLADEDARKPSPIVSQQPKAPKASAHPGLLAELCEVWLESQSPANSRPTQLARCNMIHLDHHDADVAHPEGNDVDENDALQCRRARVKVVQIVLYSARLRLQKASGCLRRPSHLWGG